MKGGRLYIVRGKLSHNFNLPRYIMLDELTNIETLMFRYI